LLIPIGKKQLLKINKTGRRKRWHYSAGRL